MSVTAMQHRIEDADISIGVLREINKGQYLDNIEYLLQALVEKQKQAAIPPK